MRTVAVLLSVLLITPAAKSSKKTRRAPPPPDIEDVAAQLMGRALTSDGAMDKLIELCDDIGHRLAGSPQLAQAVTWGHDKMAAEGLEAHLEPVMVPAWVRGHQKAVLKGPFEQKLNILTLGNSVGTPDGPIEGDVVVVANWDELAALGDRVKGKIVLYDVPFTTYGETVQYRGKGASEAARLGAIAAMVRSVGPTSLDTPHTGAMYYADDVPQIPSIAVTIEAAATMHRLQDRGLPMRLSLDLGAHFIEDQPSHNVVGEIRGRELPDEIVLMGCHLDSWDVGQGAQDDGAGCTAVMEAGRLIAALPVAPRRTVRVVLFTNEENGLRGGKAYGEAHGDERFVAAMEMDTGAGAPQGWRIDARDENEEVQAERVQKAIDALAPVSRLLAPLNASELTAAYGGADVGPLAERGHLTMGLKMDTTEYWPIHHTSADTIDKIDPQNLRRNVAALAVTTWWLAENPEAPLD